MTWLALFVLAGGTYLLRVSGLLLADRLRIPDAIRRYFDLAATVLLTALAVTAAFDGWERPAGVLVGGIAAWRGVPFVLVVLLAAGVTAFLRIA